MRIYKVGGAVRDKLMGLQPKDNDWLVVGASVLEMEKIGFQKVGKDFPVFLHSETKEEYALARKESKTGKGYKGFKFDFSADVTLEEDLKRRDLTINAIAEDQDGKLIDPYGGKKDIEAKILKNVSESFFEDPLRALRVARFYAQFEDFSIHPDTEDALQKISETKELKDLSKDRVWLETVKGLELNFERFLYIIKKFSLDMPWYDELNVIPSITSSNPNIKWCQVSEKNNFRFAEKLLISNSIKRTLEIWSQISRFDITCSKEEKISFFKLMSSQNYKKEISEVLECFPQLDNYISKILNDYAAVNFEYLNDLSSNEIIDAKNKELKRIIEKNG